MATRAKELSDLGNSGHLNVHDDGTVTLEGGNVGIGVIDPDSALEVQSASSGNNSLHIANTSSTGYGAKFLGGGNTATRYIADFRNYSGVSKVKIDGDGNVGIGTTTITTSTLGTNNRFLEVSAGTNNGSGTLVLSRNTSADNTEIGGIRFVNQNNADDTNLDADGKFVAAISVRSKTSDSNASDDSGADMIFYTKPEAGNYTERLRLQSGGNVGIGDSTPTEGKLVVRGDANTNGLFVGGNSTTGQSYGALINAGTNSSDANFRLYDQSGSTPYLFVRGDGNVSINTATPDIFNFRIATDSILSGSDYSWPFDITRAGQTNSRGFSIGQQTGSGVTALGNHNGDMALGHTFGSDSNSQPIFYETMRIKHIDQDVGRVGIGITSPTVKLDVRSSEDPSDGTIVFLRNEVASGNGAFIRYDVNNVGDWAIGIPDNRNAFTIWKDSGNTGTEYFTITADGGVGIGTDTVANAKLEISGGGIDIQDSGYPRVRFYVGSTFKGGVEAVQNVGSMISTSVVNDLAIRSQSNMLFAAGGNTEHMRINSSGNIGIGTTNPSHILEVSGTAADGTELLHIRSDGDVANGGYHWMSTEIAGSQSTNANIIHFIGRELASKNGGYFGFHYAGDHSDDNFITLGGYAADQLLNIKMNGNVGIGTTSPDYTLVVGNNSTYHTLKVQGINANLGATVKFKHHGGGGRTGIDPEWNISRGSNQTSFNTGVTSGNALVGGLAFWNNTIGGSNVDAMRLKDNGDAIFGYNVGIGITNPSAKLHTTETTSNTISAATAGVKFDGSGNDGLAFGNMASSPYASWIQAGYLADGYSPAFNNGYPIALNPVGGNVGIGITNPTEKLHVAGVIRSDGYDTDSITSYNITGSYTAGTEYVFTTRTAINNLGYGNGFYKFLVWSDTFHAGTSHYQCYTPYDEFYFNNYGSNASGVQTINYGVSMGHAPNTFTRAIDIKLRHKYGADATYPANQTFTFVPVNGFTNLNGNAGYHLRIYLFKVG